MSSLSRQVIVVLVEHSAYVKAYRKEDKLYYYLSKKRYKEDALKLRDRNAIICLCARSCAGLFHLGTSAYKM